MPDPSRKFDTDDEVVFMAGDAGRQAPSGQTAPAQATNGQTVTVVDPTSGARGFVYLFIKPGGSSFNGSNGYVGMTRDASADQWIDRYSFAPSDNEKLGSSNTGYGPNIPGKVCVTSPGNDGGITTADGAARDSRDRTPRDGMTVTTPTYRLRASGRWMVRQYNITKSGTTSDYGPNLISRWKGRAFQQTPDSIVGHTSGVGFEDEQVNWEMNSALLGWKVGPVRAIREVWGADSGTNVTKTEIYYRDADIFHFHVRVHPIPPDGFYSFWDFRLGDVNTYYNTKTPGGVPIDGTNTHNVGELDQTAGQNLYVATCDPTVDICTAQYNPEEIAGPNGAMVYVSEMVGPTSAAHPAVIPYYRDDACLDDGTGDGPVPRPWPKERTTDTRVRNGYVDYWRAHGMPSSGTTQAAYDADYAQLKCQPAKFRDPATPLWQQVPFQGAIGQLGTHYLLTGDSDNATLPKAADEIDAQQWRYAVPMAAPANVTGAFGNNVVVPLRAVVEPADSPAANAPEVPWAPLVPIVGLLGAIAVTRRKRHRQEV
jgi:hypothetical protein